MKVKKNLKMIISKRIMSELLKFTQFLVKINNSITNKILNKNKKALIINKIFKDKLKIKYLLHKFFCHIKLTKQIQKA